MWPVVRGLPNNLLDPLEKSKYQKTVCFETPKNKKWISGQLKDEPKILGAKIGQVSQKAKKR